MKDRIVNQLDMVGACLAVADRAEYQAVWNAPPSLDFGTDLSPVRGMYQSIRTAASAAYATTTGTTDAKAQAETTLESAAYILARACVAHFRKTGDLTRLAKVDFTRNVIQRLRHQDLLSTTTLIRDTAQGAQAEAGAAGRGVTTARITALTNAITAFSALLNAPRGQIANRTALIRDVETNVAELLTKVEALDDLVLQFDGTPAGRNFIAAWKQARMIVDGGHGQGEEEPPAGGGTPPANP